MCEGQRGEPDFLIPKDARMGITIAAVMLGLVALYNVYLMGEQVKRGGPRGGGTLRDHRPVRQGPGGHRQVRAGLPAASAALGRERHGRPAQEALTTSTPTCTVTPMDTNKSLLLITIVGEAREVRAVEACDGIDDAIEKIAAAITHSEEDMAVSLDVVSDAWASHCDNGGTSNGFVYCRRSLSNRHPRVSFAVFPVDEVRP